MYHPQVVQASIDLLSRAFRVPVVEHSVDECSDWTDRLSDAVDPKGKPLREITKAEQAFIQNELLMTKASFEYWCSRYAFISVLGSGLGHMYPLLDSQKFILAKIAEQELLAHSGSRTGALMFNILKAARQIGASTLAEALNAHCATTQNNIFGLIASDEPDEKGSGYLFSMFERIIENLPWWLKPKTTDWVKNTEIRFDGGTHFFVGAGKSMKGTVGQRGQLGRGMTISRAHLSELSTWENPQQIDSALLPTAPDSPRTMFILESTAKGRGNWWHRHWKTCKTGQRFTNIFIPWFAEPRYSKPAPPLWLPSSVTLEHAKKCEESSERWLNRTKTPTKDQLYWYETNRSYYESKDDLKTFLEEFGSVDDEECFQISGMSVFPSKILEQTQRRMKPLIGSIEVAPQKDLR